jgi:drug/metabolite transporter (DMT)-like permease
MDQPPDSRLLTQNRGILLGSLTALVSATTFALNMVLADISYDHGANIHALNFARAEVFFGCLLLVVVVKRSNLAMSSTARLAILGVGLLLCSLMYALLGAVQTIPVALAVLIFYTYPILIAVYRWIKGEDQFSFKALGLMVIAFVGLVLVLLNAPITLQITGICFSVGAAFIMATMLITSERNLNQYDTFVVMVQVLAVVTAILLLLPLTVVEHHWPESDAGWLAFAGSTIFYVVATFTLFKAVSLVGPLRTAIIDNTAPVWAMLFGYLLLQQSLSPLQLGGAAVVVGSVMLLQLIS